MNLKLLIIGVALLALGACSSPKTVPETFSGDAAKAQLNLKGDSKYGLSFGSMAYYQGKLHVLSNAGLLVLNGNKLEAVHDWPQYKQSIHGPWHYEGQNQLWLSRWWAADFVILNQAQWESAPLPFSDERVYVRDDVGSIAAYSIDDDFYYICAGLVWHRLNDGSQWQLLGSPPLAEHHTTERVVAVTKSGDGLKFIVERKYTSRWDEPKKPHDYSIHQKVDGKWTSKPLLTSTALKLAINGSETAMLTGEGRVLKLEGTKPVDLNFPGKADAIIYSSQGRLLAASAGKGIFELENGRWRQVVEHQYQLSSFDFLYSYLAEHDGQLAYSVRTTSKNAVSNDYEYRSGLWILIDGRLVMGSGHFSLN